MNAPHAPQAQPEQLGLMGNIVELSDGKIEMILTLKPTGVYVGSVSVKVNTKLQGVTPQQAMQIALSQVLGFVNTQAPGIAVAGGDTLAQLDKMTGRKVA